MKCDRVTGKKKCTREAVAFTLGQNVCREHEHTGDEHCTHSLAPSGRCAFCGAHTNRAVRTDR